jgi:putative Ca2+/H+ antiporter (TMEM165/GDT1 family)
MDVRLFLTVFATVFLAELGDKTQLATLLYAADRPGAKLVVFLGAAAALVTTSAIGVAAGTAIAAYVSPRLLARVAGVGFIALGAWTLVRA